MAEFYGGYENISYKNGSEHVRADIVAGSCSELVGLTELEGKVLKNGCTAWAVTEGEFCGFYGGKWYRQSDGSEVTDLSAARLSLSDTSQPLDTAESEVTADALNVGSAESE